ncbi:MAG: hypothetical protein OEY14_06755, partial [Myxococcales bacterium]|nr:hypothetical protein [Myxococcales bacterium]
MGWRRTGEGQLRGPRGEALSSERVLARPLDALAGGLHLRVADRDPGRALAAQRWHMGPEAAIAAMAPPLELGLFLHGLELGQGGERIVCPWPLLCPRRTSLIEVGLAILLPIREEQLGLLTLERAGEVQARGAG